jgi:hypothetical protein
MMKKNDNMYFLYPRFNKKHMEPLDNEPQKHETIKR